MSIGAGPQPSNFPYGFANGALVRGVPINPTTPGRVLWVYNGGALAMQGSAGSDGNPGSFQSPKATIAGALLQCTAGRGDVIFVKPGHSETITAAGALTLSLSNVTIIGLGSGSARPSLVFSGATTASILVSAGGCGLINFSFDFTGINSLANPINVQAGSFTFAGNYVQMAAGANAAAIGILTNASAGGLVCDSNVFEGGGAGTPGPFIQVVGGDGIQITNNYANLSPGAAVGLINNITTASTNMKIQGNVLINSTAVSTKTATLLAGTTGIISDNRSVIASGNAPYTAAGMGWQGNYSGAAGVVGVLG